MKKIKLKTLMIYIRAEKRHFVYKQKRIESDLIIPEIAVSNDNFIHPPKELLLTVEKI